MVNYQGLGIAAALGIAALLVAFRFGAVKNPITVVTLWWTLWMGVSAWSPFGLDTPSVATYALFGLSLAGFLLGSVLEQARPVRAPASSGADVWSQPGFERAALFFALGLLLFLCGLSWVARSSVALDADIRGAALGAIDGPDPVFGDVRYRSLFNAIAPGAMLLLLVYGNWRYFREGRYAVLLAASACASVYSVALYGRLWLQVVVIVGVVALLVAGRLPSAAVRQRVRRGRAVLAVSALLAVALSWTVTQQRADGQGSVGDAVVTFVQYHTFGFTLIDHELTDVTSWLSAEERTAGLLTVNGLHDIAAILIRRFDPGYANSGAEAFTYRQRFRTVGIWANRPVMYNAYYTFMFTLLSDGGVAYVFLGPLALGWWCMANYRRFLTSGAFKPFCHVLIAVWLAMFSLFQSAIEGSAFWMAIIVVNVASALAHVFMRQRQTRGRSFRRLATDVPDETAGTCVRVPA